MQDCKEAILIVAVMKKKKSGNIWRMTRNGRKSV